MPVRRRGALLIGASALLGLCLGCRSVPAKPDGQAARPAAEGSSRSWLAFRHSDPNFKPSNPAGKTAAKKNADKDDQLASSEKPGPAAILRPVASRSASEPAWENGPADPWRSVTAKRPPPEPTPPVINTTAATDPGLDSSR